MRCPRDVHGMTYCLSYLSSDVHDFWFRLLHYWTSYHYIVHVLQSALLLDGPILLTQWICQVLNLFSATFFRLGSGQLRSGYHRGCDERV